MQAVNFIKSCGYRVFVRGPVNGATYCFYTDGKRIGYAQWSTMRQSVSSVHKPNRQTGTGFQIADEITAASLARALDCHAPHWALESDRRSVVKYHDWDAYLSASQWNSELTEV